MLGAYVHDLKPGKVDAPLLFLFHGTGGTGKQLLPLGGELLPEARIVAPSGDVSERGAARFFRRTGEGVYDMADLARATAKMAGFIDAHVAAAGAAKVVGLGYSNGANILASVLFERPDLFDAVVLMHPLIPWNPEGAKIGARVLITAGERDPICPVSLTRGLEASLRARRAEVTMHWHPGGHGIAPSEIEAAHRFLQADAPMP